MSRRSLPGLLQCSGSGRRGLAPGLLDGSSSTGPPAVSGSAISVGERSDLDDSGRREETPHVALAPTVGGHARGRGRARGRLPRE
ncbi:hypothetical protein [Arcanobacterium phocae]|uniref:hypothetical protein n=1 Tax=Arcanobacterium phocae TaxID=131112 RepID=UPI000B01E8E1|nr:hypothetical protein [Arcanobacterium phocae]